MIDKSSVKKHFSSNAHNYDSYAIVQKKMAKRLLSEVIGNRGELDRPDILEIGCGTGYLTGLIYNQFKEPVISAYDIAPGMITESKKKFEDKNIDFICDDIESAELKGEYDLVVSNATFQWFNELESTCIKLVKSLKKDGVLVFSTFGEKTFYELYDSFESAKYEYGISEESRLGQSFYSVDDIRGILESVLKKCGLKCDIRISESLEYEYFDSVKEFMYSIKKIGANNSNCEKRAKSPAVIKRMMGIYEKNYRNRGKVVATYHCIYATVENKGETI